MWIILIPLGIVTGNQDTYIYASIPPSFPTFSLTNRFHIALEGENIVNILTEWLPVIQHKAHHCIGIDVALFTARLREDIFRGQIVERGVGCQVATTVPLPELKCGLRTRREGEKDGRRRREKIYM